MNILEEIKSSIIAGHSDSSSKYPPEMQGLPGAKELVLQAIENNIPVISILNNALISGMNEVGKKYSDGEYFVPQMLISAQAMKTGMKILEPILTGEGHKKAGTVILGTVKNDIHDIGKNLVAMMLEGSGFNVIDLGTNIPPEKFIEQAKRHPEAVIGMSALLTTTMENMRTAIMLFKNERLQNKIIVGGAAVTKRFADEINADGYSKDAVESVSLVRNLIGISA